MGLINLASGSSLWKGIEYYQKGKVKSVKQIDENTYKSEVQGSDNKSYHVHIDIEHPRKSKCNCPFADGRRVICKHMVALYFTVRPEEAEHLIKEAEEIENEEELLFQEKYKEIEEYVYSLSLQELRNMLINYMLDEIDNRFRYY